MQALVYTAPDTVQLQALAQPTANVPALAGAVRLRVDAVGICGSDLHAFRGHDPRRVPPLVLGHEFVGTVLEGELAGQRFTANPLVTCGVCRYCKQGRTNLCSDRSMIGMNLPGAFAEQLLVPTRCLVPVPASLVDEKAALAEPAATVLHALRLTERVMAQPWSETRALVLGAGAIGLLATLWLKHRGVAALHVVETNPLRAQALHNATGLRAFSDPSTASNFAASFDFVFDAVGVAATREHALRAVAPGAVVAHVGLGQNTSPLDWRTLTLAEITLVGCYTYSTPDLQAAVQGLAAGHFGTLEWVEQRALSEGANAFADLVGGRVSSAKIVLRPGS